MQAPTICSAVVPTMAPRRSAKLIFVSVRARTKIERAKMTRLAIPPRTRAMRRRRFAIASAGAVRDGIRTGARGGSAARAATLASRPVFLRGSAVIALLNAEAAAGAPWGARRMYEAMPSSLGRRGAGDRYEN